MFAKIEADVGEDDEEAVEADEDEVPGQEDKSDPLKSRGNYKYESKTEIILTVGLSLRSTQYLISKSTMSQGWVQALQA